PRGNRKALEGTLECTDGGGSRGSGKRLPPQYFNPAQGLGRGGAQAGADTHGDGVRKARAFLPYAARRAVRVVEGAGRVLAVCAPVRRGAGMGRRADDGGGASAIGQPAPDQHGPGITEVKARPASLWQSAADAGAAARTDQRRRSNGRFRRGGEAAGVRHPAGTQDVSGLRGAARGGTWAVAAGVD